MAPLATLLRSVVHMAARTTPCHHLLQEATHLPPSSGSPALPLTSPEGTSQAAWAPLRLPPLGPPTDFRVAIPHSLIKAPTVTRSIHHSLRSERKAEDVRSNIYLLDTVGFLNKS